MSLNHIELNSYVLMTIFIILFPCGVLSAALVVSKNQQYWIWLFARLVFGTIALIGSSYAKDNSISSIFLIE